MTEMKNFIQSVLILIAVLTSTTGAQGVVYAQVGDTVTLNAPVVNNLPDFYLYWYRNDVRLAWRTHIGGTGFIDSKKDKTVEIWDNKLSLSDSSLVIKDIQEEHFGTFVCKVIVASKEVATTVITLIKLTVTVEPSHLLLRGETLSLRCSTANAHGIKSPEIHWLNPQGEKINRQGTNQMQVTDKHNGRWTCVVTHDNKIQTVEISVAVFVEFSPKPSPVFTSMLSPLTIPCTIPDHVSWEKIKAREIQEVEWHFSPKPYTNFSQQKLFSLSLDSLTWKPDTYKELIPAKNPQNTLKALSLTRKRCTEENRGDYTCIMTFKNGLSVSRTVHVNVLDFKSSPGTDLISGQQVNLTCHLGRPLPSHLQLRWLPPKDSSLTPDHHSTHLTIPEVEARDSGKWRCELWQNSTMLTSAEITLKIEHKLNVWMLMIISGVAVIVILLLVLFFICRRRQRKTRHPRHRLCQCKNPKPKGFYRS